MKEKLFSITKDDFEIQTFRSGGKGGQHQNKTDSGVRLIHKESRISSESRSERSQHQNKKLAFRKLVNSKEFKLWINKKIFEMGESHKKLINKIEKEMDLNNVKIEVKIDNQWKDIDDNV